MKKRAEAPDMKKLIEKIVLENEIYEQEQVVTMLSEKGITTTQPSVSKYLSQLKLEKCSDGYYVQTEEKKLENKKKLLLELVTNEADYIKKYTLAASPMISEAEEMDSDKKRKKGSNLYAVAIKVRNGYETSIADLVAACFSKHILGVTTGRLCVFIYTTSEDRSKEVLRFLMTNRKKKKEEGLIEDK